MKTTIKRFLVALLAVALLPLSGDAQTILRTRTFSNVQIAAGADINPDSGTPEESDDGVGIPKRSQTARVTLTRTNWPADGVDLTIDLTYDSVTWVSCFGSQLLHIGPDSINPKNGLPYGPATISCGWNPDRFQPIRGRLRTVSPEPFTTTITVEYID